MFLIGIGIAAFLARKAYDHMVEVNPEGTRSGIDRIFQGAELIRTIAAFITSMFLIFRGQFRPSVLSRTRFGQAASDEE